MKKYLPFLLAILCTGLSATAKQKTLNIVTVNNPGMITLKRLSSKFEAANPDIKLNWLVLEENIMRQRITTDISTGGGQFDVVFIGLYEALSLPSADGSSRWRIFRLNMILRTFSSRFVTASLTMESYMLCLSMERVRC